MYRNIHLYYGEIKRILLYRWFPRPILPPKRSSIGNTVKIKQGSFNAVNNQGQIYYIFFYLILERIRIFECYMTVDKNFRKSLKKKSIRGVPC